MESSLQRWKCRCAYDGGAFAGWQSQAGGKTVQDAIEAELGRVFQRPVRIHGSGRTDAGVHARGQVFHFDAEWRHGAVRLAAALRSRMPREIRIGGIARAPRNFHARFSAKGKIYSYHLFLGDPDPFERPYCWVVERPLDWKVMERAAALLRGRHDFRAFSAWNRTATEDTVRDLRRLEWRRRGRRVTFLVEADGFLYKMVRTLVGALVAAGDGKLAPERIERLLRARIRVPAVQTAPAQGLFLERVRY
ncbi:MAG: tRNA pseudouridine(38-40) synthase TruA [Opitutaceae bacterium]